MLVHEILTERVNVESPAFRDWFRGSKVVDANGRPLLCYHGTRGDFGDDYYPLSHFGTLGAATERLSGWGGELAPYGDDANIRPVYLRIRNPYQTVDNDGDESYAIHVLGELLQKRKIAKPLHDRLVYNYESVPDLEEEFVQIMQGLGHDGLVYRNNWEEAGSVSWVIFDPAQVWPLFRTAAPVGGA